MDKKTRWLDRSLFESPVYYCLCKNEKQFKKALKDIGNKSKDHNFLNCGSNATTHFFTYNGNSSAIVCLGDCHDHSISQIHSLLVHEAVHVFQEVKLLTGERNPSIEFEAYAIQSISQRLMESYNA